MKNIIIGIIIAIAGSLLIDLLLFGTIQPCQTVERFEDGSSIQHCSVRN